jgi:hypothetical protein
MADKTFTERLIAVQSQLKVPKNQYNDYGGFKYRSCEDILEAVKPLLQKEGLYVTIADDIVVIGERFYVKATATLSDGENAISNHAFAREDAAKKGMDGSQVTGTASSYARKYALNGLLAIDDTKDADTLNNGKEYTATSKASVKAMATAPTPKIPAPDKAAVIAAVYAAQTEEEVVAIYKKNSYYFGKDEAVITACSQRKQQLKQG